MADHSPEPKQDTPANDATHGESGAPNDAAHAQAGDGTLQGSVPAGGLADTDAEKPVEPGTG